MKSKKLLTKKNFLNSKIKNEFGGNYLNYIINLIENNYDSNKKINMRFTHSNILNNKINFNDNRFGKFNFDDDKQKNMRNNFMIDRMNQYSSILNNKKLGTKKIYNIQNNEIN